MRKNKRIITFLSFLLLLLPIFGWVSSRGAFSHAAKGDGSVLVENNFVVLPQHENKPVRWSVKVEDKGCDATLIITADTDKKWKLYTQFPSDPMGYPTQFTFSESTEYKVIGKAEEPPVKAVYDELLMATVESFKDYPVVFRQKIKKTGKIDFTVKINVEYMTCDDEKCIVDQETLEIKVKGADCLSSGGEEEQRQKNGLDSIPAETEGTVDKLTPVSVQVVTYQTSTDKYELQFIAQVDEGWTLFTQGNDRYNFTVSPSSKTASFKDSLFSDAGSENVAKERVVLRQTMIRNDFTDSIFKGSFQFYVEKNGEVSMSERIHFTSNLNQARFVGGDSGMNTSYWVIFVVAFLSGFLALLTPCVFPMIPMTVSFFIKQSKNKTQGLKNAFTYGISIIAIYVALGLLVTGIFGSDALNALATDIYFNLFFFFLLIIFGISFLGAFEITLPASWVNRADKQADRGGLIGIFFMAFTLALVSFSCTGPIIGTLLVQAADQGGMAPFFGMLGFSTALALPFTLFAAFPGWLNAMPQSGGWLNTVKVTLGLLEIAFAFKFLSNADLVMQAHLLERETFIAIWIAVFSVLGLYLLGKIKFPHDSEVKYLSVPRGMLAIFTFAFVVYMVPGMWGAPVKWIAGFPPPIHYSEAPYGIGGLPPDAEGLPYGAEYGPHRLVTFHEYEDALAYARKEKKPLMLDFTGYACVNCRKMEENVWSDERVLNILKNNVVIASLHVDDKKKLPKEEVKEIDGFLMKTVGNKWSYFQKKNYGSNSQPQYILLDENEQMLTVDASYEKHWKIADFLAWLNNGLEAYEERKNAPIFKPLVSKVEEIR